MDCSASSLDSQSHRTRFSTESFCCDSIPSDKISFQETQDFPVTQTDTETETRIDMCSTQLLKRALMSRWILLLGAIGINDRMALQDASPSDPYRAALGMVDTAFRERGPMTALEGAILKGFFIKEAMK